MKVITALALVSGLLEVAPTTASVRKDPRIVAVRIQGNHTLSDAEVLSLASISPGERLEAETVDAVRERLLESGKFATVEVRVRYQSLSESGDVALIVLVREKSSAANHFMFGPIVDISSEYGLTLGGRLALVDVVTKGGRIAFPLSWGGKRQAGVEASFPVGSHDRHQLRIDLSRWRQVNPHFEIPDNRLELGGRFATRIRRASFDFGGKWSDVDFDLPNQRFAELDAKAIFDTRIDPAVPGNAFYSAFGWRRLFLLEGDGSELPDVNQFVIDLRGYRRLLGQSLLAAQLFWAFADGPLPSYEQPFVGGGQTLRGHSSGRFIGDNAAHATLELRVPLTSPTSFARAGVLFFYDTGTTYDHGESLGGSRFYHGVGLGAFFKVLVTLRVDVGWDLEGGTRFDIESQMKF